MDSSNNAAPAPAPLSRSLAKSADAQRSDALRQMVSVRSRERIEGEMREAANPGLELLRQAQASLITLLSPFASGSVAATRAVQSNLLLPESVRKAAQEALVEQRATAELLPGLAQSASAEVDRALVGASRAYDRAVEQGNAAIVGRELAHELRDLRVALLELGGDGPDMERALDRLDSAITQLDPAAKGARVAPKGG